MKNKNITANKESKINSEILTKYRSETAFDHKESLKIFILPKDS